MTIEKHKRTLKATITHRNLPKLNHELKVTLLDCATPSRFQLAVEKSGLEIPSFLYKSLEEERARCLERFREQDKELESDPTPWCNSCGAKTKQQCECGPIAENE